MTNTNPDPVELAREVLQAVAEERQTALTGSTLDNSLAIEELFDAALAAAPALAHAVIRIADLADRLDDGHLRYLIRSTLNGETR